MNEPSAQSLERSFERQSVWGGTLRVFIAELLIVPTGLLIAIFLSRRLGPASYGLYSLVAVLTIWIEATIAAIFSRAMIKFVGEADAWRAVGATALRWYGALTVGAVALLWIFAEPISVALGEPTLVNYLRWFALDIPLFVLARAHRDILIGIGGFRQRAWTSTGRWLARLCLIVLLVELGFGIAGAIVGCIGASLIELLIARRYVRPSPFHPASFPARRLWSYAAPLFLFALAFGGYDKLGLLTFKVLGGTAEGAGLLSAAQNLTIVPGILALSFSPLLLAALTRALRDGNDARARKLAHNAMRVVILLLPFAGMTAGMAREVVGWVLGEAFLPAAPLLAWLIFGALALLMISVASAILIAANKPHWTFELTGIGLLIALVGYLLAMPSFGALGVAVVTTLAAWLAALLMLAGVYRAWKIVLSRGTLLRAIVVTILAYVIAALWVTPGVGLLLKVAVIAVVIAGAFLLLGEFGRDELARAWRGCVAQTNHRQAGPSISRDFDYWDRALYQIENQGHYLDAFRGEMKRQAHLALIARWSSAARTGRVLKTDLFEEASGADAFLLDLDYHPIVGMDISSGITRRAQTRDANRRAQYVTADVRQLPFASGSFALIVSPSTLDHFADPTDLERSLRELTRVLEQGGRLIVTLDNRQNIFDPLMRLAARLGWMPYFLGHSYTIRELRAALEKIGLRVEDTAAILHNPRLVAAAAMLVANRLGWQWLIRLVQRALVAMQRLEGTRWQYYTGSFIAAVGVRQDG